MNPAETVSHPVPSRSSHLLFVDDEPRVLDSIRRTMRTVGQGWRASFAGSVDAALATLVREEIDVIITDFNMPGRDGFDFMRALADTPASAHIPVLMLTGNADVDLKRRALEAGAFDLVSKPISREDLVARIGSVLRTKRYADELAALNATLDRQVKERTRELERSRTDIMLCLAMAGECRDTDTGHHLVRVAHYSRVLASGCGLSEAQVRSLFLTSPLHDIGKVGIPDEILLKPGPLTDSERATMQTHCVIGHRILTRPQSFAGVLDSTESGTLSEPNPLLTEAAIIALNHHERWDGRGYPHGVAGESIPLQARIVAIADVYDALTTARPYKEALSHGLAAQKIVASSGTHFDPDLVKTFQEVLPLIQRHALTWPSIPGAAQKLAG